MPGSETARKESPTPDADLAQPARTPYSSSSPDAPIAYATTDQRGPGEHQSRRPDGTPNGGCTSSCSAKCDAAAFAIAGDERD